MEKREGEGSTPGDRHCSAGAASGPCLVRGRLERVARILGEMLCRTMQLAQQLDGAAQEACGAVEGADGDLLLPEQARHLQAVMRGGTTRSGGQRASKRGKVLEKNRRLY